jgi:hypothetical protein
VNFHFGDYGTLAAVSRPLALAYGQDVYNVDTAMDTAARVGIAERLIQQHALYPEQFERAMRDYGNDSDGLRKEAMSLGLPFYTFAYGIPQYVAEAVGAASDCRVLYGIITMGSVEPEVIGLLREKGPHFLERSLAEWYVGDPFAEYSIRNRLMTRLLGTSHAYALFLAGADIDSLRGAGTLDDVVWASIALGAHPSYALNVYSMHSQFDPRIVAAGSRDGVPIEYVGASS